jgi:sec-independent protein translocase protein TatA
LACQLNPVHGNFVEACRVGVRTGATVLAMGIHWQELVIILVLALVLFGPRRLPEIGRSLGHGIREFRDTMSGATSPSATPAKVADDADTTPTA